MPNQSPDGVKRNVGASGPTRRSRERVHTRSAQTAGACASVDSWTFLSHRTDRFRRLYVCADILQGRGNRSWDSDTIAVFENTNHQDRMRFRRSGQRSVVRRSLKLHRFAKTPRGFRCSRSWLENYKSRPPALSSSLDEVRSRGTSSNIGKIITDDKVVTRMAQRNPQRM